MTSEEPFSALSISVEALRLYLEKELGIKEFLLAYKHLSESRPLGIPLWYPETIFSDEARCKTRCGGSQQGAL